MSAHAKEPKRVIITGGPGAGKTTLLIGMERLGFDVVTEAASDIIKLELAKSIKEPWNQEDFQKKVLELQMLRQKKSMNSKTPLIFYDRAPFDTMTYQIMKWPDLERDYLDSTLEQLKKEDFFHTTVFVVENFGECEHTDLRHESNNEAVEIQKRIIEEYKKHGFNIVKVPPADPEKRIRIILEELAMDTSTIATR